MGKLQRIGGGADGQAAIALERAAMDIEIAATRSAYVRDVAQYLAHVQQTGEALAEGLQSWKDALRSRGALVATVNRKLSAVKTAMRKAAEKLPPQGRREIEAALASVRGIRQSRAAIRAEKMLTPEEVGKLIQRLSDRGKLFVRFLYSTGCRVSEMTGIRLFDCKVNGGVTIEVLGKGGKARKVRIPSTTALHSAIDDRHSFCYIHA